MAAKPDRRVRRDPSRLAYKKAWREANSDRVRAHRLAFNRRNGIRPIDEVRAEVSAKWAEYRAEKAKAKADAEAASHARRAAATEKACAKCNVTKPIDAFARTRGTIDGREYHCKACRYAAKSAYRKTAAFRQKQATESSRLDRYAAHVRGRSRRLYGVEENITAADVGLIFALYADRCFKCRASKDLTLDHHLPIVNGAPLLPANAVVLCRSCNSTKNSAPIAEFYSPRDLAKLAAIFEALGSSRTGVAYTGPGTAKTPQFYASKMT